jgi:CO/xanthine dehydrogenase Mo-binding subunit
MTGAAVTIAAAKLRQEVLTVAGQLLQTAPDRLAFAGNRVIVSAAPDGPSLDLAQVAQSAGGEIAAEATFTTDKMTYPYGVHLAQVRVERDSCAIVVERFFVGYDIGRSINPMLVEGQIVGGAVQGIGGALFEAITYDAAGQPLTTTLMDYLLPCAADVPRFTLIHQHSPSPLNPFGVKGVGEGGPIAPPAAIANAVADALRPAKVEFNRTPVAPQHIVAAVRSAVHA